MERWEQLSVKTIPLTQGKVALVDAEDYEELSKYNWVFDGHAYARRQYRDDKKKRWVHESMHRRLAKTPEGMQTDHINGDGLDNRKSNLRVCTVSQNAMNQKRPKNNISGYKGVFYRTAAKKHWCTCITYNGKRIWGKRHETPEDAYEEYKELAKKYHKEFANVEC